SKRANRENDAMTVTGYNLLIGGLVLLLSGLAGGGTLNTVCAAGIAVLLYLAFLSAAAFTLWTMLLNRVGVGNISSFNFIIPVSGTILSSIFMHENILDWKYAVSLILVCAGILLVNLPREK
ncbi:MAG: EamA family transporter, partial [Candidatus Ornithomonoglobus sp.]